MKNPGPEKLSAAPAKPEIKKEREKTSVPGRGAGRKTRLRGGTPPASLTAETSR